MLQYDDYYYYQLDEDEDGNPDYIKIIGFDTSATEVEIPSEIDGLPVTSIEEYAFAWCDSLESVTIRDGVKSIGYRAFYDCTSLKKITIPESVTSIGSSAFENTLWLEVKQAENSLVIVNNILIDGRTYEGDIVEIPPDVTSIGECAFEDCYGLTSVTIPNSVTSIGDKAFYGCENLTDINVSESNEYYSSIDGVLFNKEQTELIQYPIANTRSEYTIPKSVTRIDDSAFEDCEYLEIVTIQDGVTSIGDSAFQGCRRLAIITIPDSVTRIGDFAFEYCVNLTRVTIGDGVTSIGRAVFYDAPWLKAKQTENPLVIVNNILIDGTTCKGDVVIPESITSIAGWAFNSSVDIEKVTIEDGVTSIGPMAFAFCWKLTHVIIKNPECEIYATDGSEPDFTRATICGYENSTAHDYADMHGYEFELIENAPVQTTPVVTIPVVTSPILTKPVETIITYGALSCTKLDEDRDGNYDCIEITDCDTSATEVEIPSEIDGLPVTSIGNFAFEGCSSLKSIEIPKSVTSIGYFAFYSCDDLISITIENSECDIYDSKNTISDTATIYSYENSTAQYYAEMYERNFAAIDKPAQTTVVTMVVIVTMPTTVSETVQIVSKVSTETTSATEPSVSETTTIGVTTPDLTTSISKSETDTTSETTTTTTVSETEPIETTSATEPNVSETTTAGVTTPIITTSVSESETDTNSETTDTESTNTTVSSDETPETTETTVTEPTEPGDALKGDANGDGKVNVRDCAFIATALAKGEGDTLPSSADYSDDGKINVRDAAAIASALAKGEIID